LLEENPVMLKFIGIGSAFNTRLGNTGAFIRKDRSLLLIDTGGTIFQRAQELKLMDEMEQLTIIITHTHPDHVGSLGDFIFYAHYILHMKPVVIFPDEELIRRLLECVGVTSFMYELKCDLELTSEKFAFAGATLKLIRIPHVETIPAFAFILELGEKRLYYSGDANMIPKEVIEMLGKGELDMIYQDTSGLDYDGNVHLSLKKLAALIPPELRSKVYCMHHDQSLDLQQVTGYGFNIVGKYTG
jgi:ribonuclease BN (tRNA processing enzyme)